ncbi:MAG TPA: diacylglycerol kinase family protein [Casimicrobiaceae bacterium]|nr:diacylglycerol kinase family protein [Casimicrobiaceae bacterium]
MRVLLIYNPKAGNGVDDAVGKLVEMIRAAGHDASWRSSKDRRLRSAFVEPFDVIAVAGGDGTVAKVARLLRGRDAAIAPLPLGTANNIATALGVADSEPEEHIRGWSKARRVAFDLGLARGPWGSRVFLESFGVGLMPALMDEPRVPPRGSASADVRFTHAVAHARRTARRAAAIEIEAWLDGHEISGRYVLFEAMNIGLAGPNLELAPGADPADGQFDVVLVPESERSLLAEGLRPRGWAGPHALPSLRGRRLRLRRGDFRVHLDDEVEDAEGEPGGRAIEVVFSGSVDFLLPRERASGARAHTPGRGAARRRSSAR